MSGKTDETELDIDLDEGTEPEGDEEGTEKEPTPEEMKTSIANLEKALKKANREAARLRNEKKGETEAASGKGEEKPDAKGEDRYKRSAVASAARAELKEAGFTGTKEQAAKLSRLLDLDELDVDDDGEVDGLEDAVADLKEQFPALFGGTSQGEGKTKPPRVDTGTKTAPQGSIRTSVDKVAEERYARMFGGRRR